MEEEYVDRIICDCNGVTYRVIKEAITNGADTMEKIMEETNAGITCGRCRRKIRGILHGEKDQIL